MEEVNLFYPNTGNCVCVQEERPLSRYQLKMLECNEIPGMLSMHSTRINGVCTLNYDISKMQRLSSVLGKEIQGKQAKKLLLDILRALLSAEDYLLSFTRCVLNPDYIYVKSNYEVGMVYVPYENEEITSLEDVRLLYNKLLSDYLKQDSSNYNLLIYVVNAQGFSLEGLLEKLEEGMDATPAPQSTLSDDSKSVKPTPEPQKQPKALKKEKEEPKNPPKSEKTEKPEKVDAETDMPFAVPPSNDSGNKPGGKKPNTGLIGKIFGDGKKKDKVKEEVIPKEPSKGREHVPPIPQSDSADASEGGWRGTVMLQDAQSGSDTIILHEESTPMLLHRGQNFSINTFPCKIGSKGGEMDYVIPNQYISKYHATIHSSQGKYYIKDENSPNHTYLNGRQLPPYTEMELHDGDIIKLANEELKFQI